MRRLYPALIFSVLIVISILAGWWLNELHPNRIGQYLGVPGILLIIASLTYSLSKRDLTSPGRSFPLIRLHEMLAGLGGMLLLAHGRLHFNALIPSIALVMLLILLISGMIVKFTLAGVMSGMKADEEALISQGFTPLQAWREIHLQALQDPGVMKWRRIHTPAAAIFLALSLLHILGIFALWGWN